MEISPNLSPDHIIHRFVRYPDLREEFTYDGYVLISSNHMCNRVRIPTTFRNSRTAVTAIRITTYAIVRGLTTGRNIFHPTAWTYIGQLINYFLVTDPTIGHSFKIPNTSMSFRNNGAVTMNKAIRLLFRQLMVVENIII